MGRKRKSIDPWTTDRVNVLYECWKEGNDTKDRIKLIEKNLDVPLPTALSAMRKLAKSDPKWIRWATRKKNELEKAKLAKEKEIERKKQEKEQRRAQREVQRKIKEVKLREKKEKSLLESKIDNTYVSDISGKIPPEFFFCPDVSQFVNNNSCIFRVFSKDKKYEISHGGPCEKCKRMDKFIPILKELIDDRRKNQAAGGKNRSVQHQTKKNSKDKIKKTKKD